MKTDPSPTHHSPPIYGDEIKTQVVLGDRYDMARRYGVSVRTIDNLRAQGMPFVALLNRTVRFDFNVCDEWIKSLAIPGSKPPSAYRPRFNKNL